MYFLITDESAVANLYGPKVTFPFLSTIALENQTLFVTAKMNKCIHKMEPGQGSIVGLSKLQGYFNGLVPQEIEIRKKG